MLTRSELREKIMTILYQIDLYEKNTINYDINDVIKENIDVENKFVTTIVNGVLNDLNNIDKIANKYLKDWDINRLDSTGRTILRMGIYEIMYTDTPEIVVINESIELAKKYSDDNVRKMINAVLDKIVNEE